MLQFPGYEYDAFENGVCLKVSDLEYAKISPLLQIVYVPEPYMILRE